MFPTFLYIYVHAACCFVLSDTPSTFIRTRASSYTHMFMTPMLLPLLGLHKSIESDFSSSRPEHVKHTELLGRAVAPSLGTHDPKQDADSTQHPRVVNAVVGYYRPQDEKLLSFICALFD